MRCYLAPGGRLADTPGPETIADRYVVDPETGTGVHSRFGKHLGGGRFPAKFDDRRRRDEKLLTYTSDPVPRDTEITGHPTVTLHVAADTTDAAVYLYVEDVAPDGGVRYVTDGALRASWRKTGEAPYWTAWPYFPGRRDDVQLLTPGEVVTLEFDLYPTSYLLRAGHRIRVAIAGADKDNFVHVPAGERPVLSVCHGGTRASFVELPVVPRQV
jgi:putative CocE/NonD family hydrolase